MAEPFVFHWKLDPRGFPIQMTVADVRGTCSLCQHEEIQRFYRALPFHSMTLERLRGFAADVPSWTGYECANCGTDVGPEDVDASTLVWGFADDSGLVRSFRTSENLQFQLVPARRLDPQELPGFEPPPTDGPVAQTLDDAWVERELGRPFSLKLAVRDFLLESIEDDAPGWSPIGPGMSILAAMEPDEIEDDEVARSIADGSVLQVDPRDAVPAQLPTVEHPVSMPGRIETWLGPRLWGALQDRDDVTVLVDLQTIRSTLERTFDVARLAFEADDDRIHALRTPTERDVPGELRYDAVARRAVYTGISPGEAARLTAEELIAPLLNINRKRT